MFERNILICMGILPNTLSHKQPTYPLHNTGRTCFAAAFRNASGRGHMILRNLGQWSLTSHSYKCKCGCKYGKLISIDIYWYLLISIDSIVNASRCHSFDLRSVYASSLEVYGTPLFHPCTVRRWAIGSMTCRQDHRHLLPVSDEIPKKVAFYTT